MSFEPLTEWQIRMQREAGVAPGTPDWKNCFRKVRHNSQALAEAAARSVEKRFGSKQRIYRCDRCQGWHRYTV